MLSKHILTAKIMMIKNLQIKMLAGNSLKIHVGTTSQISMTLVKMNSESVGVTRPGNIHTYVVN